MGFSDVQPTILVYVCVCGGVTRNEPGTSDRRASEVPSLLGVQEANFIWFHAALTAPTVRWSVARLA